MKCLLLFGFITIAIAASSQIEPQRQCNAPNNGGLNEILDDMKSLLSGNEIFAVVFEYSRQDEQVWSIIHFLLSEEFLRMVHVLENHKAFISLVQTACNDFFLDVVYYINEEASRYGFPLIHIPQIPEPKGLKELFNKLARIIPMEELDKKLEESVKTNEYLQKALKYILSADFRTKVETLTSLPEYNLFLEKMYNLDVDVDEISDILNGVFEKIASWKMLNF